MNSVNNDQESDTSTIPSQWTMIISPQRRWYDFHMDDLWRYRDLISLFVKRDFVAYYKQTILGPLWYFIQPIFSTLVFTIIFGQIAKISTDGMPAFLFYLAGNTIWSYFASCLTATSNTFLNNAGIFGKVYFPRMTVPISIVFSNLISFGIRFCLFIVFWLFFWISGSAVKPNLWAFTLPLLIFLMGIMGLGFGIIISSLTTKYRDLQQLVGFGVQLLMYITPIVYPLSSVSGIWRTLILINPMTAVIEIFRLGFLGVANINPIWLCYTAGFTLITLLIGLALFNKVEASFMDTV
jgi:lipopolysaccharide transport system permease protein